MDGNRVKKLLEQQLELLSEKSKSLPIPALLPDYTEAMVEIAEAMRRLSLL